jgi:hypothetical protein
MKTGFVRYASHSGFLSGRAISSYMGTWVLSDHDSSAAPQTVQIASPVCGTKNFSSVRLYSAPQLHWTIVTIPGICAWDRGFATASANGISHPRSRAVGLKGQGSFRSSPTVNRVPVL